MSFNEKLDYLNNAVNRAVQEADHILVDATDGSAEELSYVTAQTALRFLEKLSFDPKLSFPLAYRSLSGLREYAIQKAAERAAHYLGK